MISCQCGEVALESALYHTKIKCSHRLFLCLKNGESLDNISPKCPNVILLYRPLKFLAQNSIIEYKIITHKNQNKNNDQDEYLMKHAAKTIKKFSHCNDKLPVIIEYLNETLKPYLHPDNSFIGPFPLSFYSAVSSGIYKFSQIIQDFENIE